MNEIRFSAKGIAPKSVQKVHVQPGVRVVIRQLVIDSPPADAYLIEFHAAGQEWLERHKLPLYLFSPVALPITMEHRIDPGGRVSLHIYNDSEQPIDVVGALLCDAL